MGSRIICGVDASPASAAAAAVAALLGSGLEAECLLLHVEPPGRAPASIAHARERGRVSALAEANDFSAGGRTEVIGGDPATELAAAAESSDIELLVMGTSGPAPTAPHGGEVSARVIESAPCPVVLVPPWGTPPFASNGARSVICALRGENQDADVLRLSIALGRRLRAEAPRWRLHRPIVILPPARSGLTQSAA